MYTPRLRRLQFGLRVNAVAAASICGEPRICNSAMARQPSSVSHRRNAMRTRRWKLLVVFLFLASRFMAANAR
jgi:hypothetical protein